MLQELLLFYLSASIFFAKVSRNLFFLPILKTIIRVQIGALKNL